MTRLKKRLLTSLVVLAGLAGFGATSAKGCTASKLCPDGKVLFLFCDNEGCFEDCRCFFGGSCVSVVWVDTCNFNEVNEIDQCCTPSQ
jgi:hypothetical protein